MSALCNEIIIPHHTAVSDSSQPMRSDSTQLIPWLRLSSTRLTQWGERCTQFWPKGWGRDRWVRDGVLLGCCLALMSCGRSPNPPILAQPLDWQSTSFFQPPPEPDAEAEEVLDTYLQNLRSRGISPKQQGIYLQSGLSRLARYQDTTPRSAASITKVATTIAAIEKWGLAHRFETTIYTTGTISEGVLDGDLIVQGTGSPFFVWEEAIAVGNALQAQGIETITGDLVVVGPFFMNYKTNPQVAGELFRVAIAASRWPRVAQEQYAELPPDTPKPEIAIQGQVRTTEVLSNRANPLLRHDSVNLANILKQMNIYSNNVMSEVLAEAAGGADVVATLAAQTAGVPTDEIQLINGSGLGRDNRISPRAAVAMFIALDQQLVQQGVSVADVFPVAGRDRGGTMQFRNFPDQTLLKTGTLNGVSALAGIVPTRDRDRIWFAIINGGGDILEFRRQQDALLQAIVQTYGSGTLQTTTNAIPDESLGDAQRISTVTASDAVESNTMKPETEANPSN